MRIEFYDAMLSDDGRTMLVKEKAAGYGAGKLIGISLLDLITDSKSPIWKSPISFGIS